MERNRSIHSHISRICGKNTRISNEQDPLSVKGASVEGFKSIPEIRTYNTSYKCANSIRNDIAI